MNQPPLTPEPTTGAALDAMAGLKDPVAWFARPLIDAAGLVGEAGAGLAALIETIASAVLSPDPQEQRRLSRHDTVAFLMALRSQMAHLEALHAHATASLTLDAAYHGCDNEWDADDGTGRACPTCTADSGSDDEPATNDHVMGGSADGGAMAWSRSESPVGRVGMELSPALGMSPTFATQLVDDSVDLISELPATWAAMVEGRLDAYRARIIAHGTRPLIDNVDVTLPEQERAADVARRERLRASIEAQVLDHASDRTGEQLRRKVRRLVLKADPTLTQHARRQGVADRRLGEPYTRSDDVAALGGVGSMTLHGPIEDLRALHVAVDAAARHAKAAEDDARTLDQLRFDILTGSGWSALRHGHLGCCARDHSDIHDAPEHTGTSAPVTAGNTSADAIVTGGNANGGHGGTTYSAATTTRPARLASTVGRRPVEIRVTVSLATLLGLSEDPADLAGIGPIPADVAATLAFSDDATWRRLVTDPLTGTLLDYGHTTYRPPAALDAYVRARDGTSRFPTSITSSDHADLDHTDPYRHGPGGSAADHTCTGAACRDPRGRTAHGNLGALTRRPHNARTKHHWLLEQPQPGRFQWTSPARHHYTVDPDPLDEPDPGIRATVAVADDPLLLVRSALEVEPTVTTAASPPEGQDDDPPF